MSYIAIGLLESAGCRAIPIRPFIISTTIGAQMHVNTVPITAYQKSLGRPGMGVLSCVAEVPFSTTFFSDALAGLPSSVGVWFCSVSLGAPALDRLKNRTEPKTDSFLLLAIPAKDVGVLEGGSFSALLGLARTFSAEMASGATFALSRCVGMVGAGAGYGGGGISLVFKREACLHPEAQVAKMNNKIAHLFTANSL